MRECGGPDDGMRSVLFYIAGLAYLHTHRELGVQIGGVVDEDELHRTFHRYAAISPWAVGEFASAGGKIRAVSDAFAFLKHMKTPDGRVSMFLREDSNRLYLGSIPTAFVGRHFNLSTAELRVFVEVVRRYMECVACIECVTKEAFERALCQLQKTEVPA